MQLRSEVPEQYKWDIGLFKTEEEIENALKIMEESTDKASKYYGKFNDPEVFFDFFYSNKNDNILMHKLYHYVGNMQSIDGANVEIKKLIQRIEILLAKNEKAYSFVNPQMNKLSVKYLKSLLNDPRSKEIENETGIRATSEFDEALSWKPDSSTASMITARAFSLTLGWLFNTRETVATA